MSFFLTPVFLTSMARSRCADRRGRRRILLDFSLTAPGGSLSYAKGFLNGLAEQFESAGTKREFDLTVLLPSRGFQQLSDRLAASGCVIVRSGAAPPGTLRAALGRQVALFWWSVRVGATDVFVPREIAPIFLRGRLAVLARNLFFWTRTPVDAQFGMKLRVRRWAARLGLRRAGVVIAPTQWLADHLPATRVTVAHYGCDVASARWTDKDAAEQKVRILCLGTVYPHKRFDLAIELVADLVQRGTLATLEIRGVCPDPALERQLEERGREVLGCNPLRGPVVAHEREALFRQADVLFVGSSTESFGFSIVEAMRTSTVVVAPKSPLIDELCGPCAVPYDEGSASSAAGAVAAALPNLRRYAECGFERAQEFTWRRCVTATLDAVLASPP